MTGTVARDDLDHRARRRAGARLDVIERLGRDHPVVRAGDR